jgi:adhesin/invasin
LALLNRIVLVSIVITLGACTDLRPGGDTADGEVIPDGAVTNCTKPVISGTDYSVVAHTATLKITGGCLHDPTSMSVTIGGVPHTPTTSTETLVELTLLDTVMVGERMLVVTTPEGTSDEYPLTVVHLTIEEVDADTTGGSDRHQFIEIGTGVVGATDLSGYVVVLVQGTSDMTYAPPLIPSIALTTTAGNGLFVVGNEMVANEQLVLSNNTLGQGPADAVFLVQTRDAVAASVPAASIPGTIIDAVVYSRTTVADDVGLLVPAFPIVGNRVQVSEGSATASVRRCGTVLRSGAMFAAAMATPGTANVCP